MIFVDRRTRCILSWRVVCKRTGAAVQEMVQESVQGRTYFSDALRLTRRRSTSRLTIIRWKTRARPTLWKGTRPDQMNTDLQ